MSAGRPHTTLRASLLRLAASGLAVAFLTAAGGERTPARRETSPNATVAAWTLAPGAPAAAVPAEPAIEVAALHYSSPPGRALAPVPEPSSTAASADCGLADLQASLLARINQYRGAGANCRTAGTYPPAPPLVGNASLLQAAAAHSLDMATRNYFSHTSHDGRTLVERIGATGYARSSLGENIAAGYPTAKAVVDGWMASDGHCANLMNPHFRDVGLACAASPTSTYRKYWTMDAGKPR